MGDSAVTIIAIFLAAILMFVFPLMTMADKSDDVSQLAVQTATTEFVNKIRTTGYISQEDYDNFILTLAATGNSYEPQFAVQKSDQNPAKKSSDDTASIGKGVEYVLYTTQVLEQLPLSLNEGDRISVYVENTNTTVASQLRNFMYRITGKSSGNIVAQESGIVTKSSAN
mgnify:CR=1 FL=1